MNRLIVGLTGPSGAGKTTALKKAEQMGFFCIDCDKTARSVTDNNELCKNTLKESFGEDILKEGILDRALLASRAFCDQSSTELLNQTVLPFVVSEILLLIEKSNSEDILIDAPTLFQSGLDEICSFTVAVLSDRDLRKQRIMKRDGISESQAEIRMSAAKDDKFFKENCDATVYNNNNKELFLQQFEEILNRIKGVKL